MLAPLKEQMREDGNHKTTYEFFVSRVQKNLHVALSMVRDLGVPPWRTNRRDREWAFGGVACVFAEGGQYLPCGI